MTGMKRQFWFEDEERKAIIRAVADRTEVPEASSDYENEVYLQILNKLTVEGEEGGDVSDDIT